jgi:hypothetical protein
MKKGLLLLSFSAVFSILFACTGDCMSCHQKLLPTIQQDKRHTPMMGCIECHSADPNSMAECGSDCFACHPVEKIEKAGVPAHNVIRGCRDCHVKMKEQFSDIAIPKDQSAMPALKELLIPPGPENGGLDTTDLQ